MNIRRLILREILFRKGNFALSVLAVIVAVGSLVAVLTVLLQHDRATSRILATKAANTAERLEKEEETTRVNLVAFEERTDERLKSEIDALRKRRVQREKEVVELLTKFKNENKARMKKLEDDYRKITKKLGFNVVIVPKKQNLIEMKAQGYVTETMPENYADKLAKSRIMTINHLLPMVQSMVKWQEKERRILLTGIRGEVPLMHKDPKKPLIQPVPKRHMVVGFELHRNFKLKQGDKVKFQGREFTVAKLQPERGTRDDITIWINLEEAQEILKQKGSINAILALECNCATVDRLGEIRKDINKILPDTYVLELHDQALARAEARNRAKKEAEDSIALKEKEATQTIDAIKAETKSSIEQKETDAAAALAQVKNENEKSLANKKHQAEAALTAERAGRAEIRSQILSFATLLIPVALLGAVIWLGLMTLNNVQQRQGEIGILRALGLSAGGVFALFVSRAAIVGLLGAIIGYAFGISAGYFWVQGDGSAAQDALFNPALLLVVLVAAPIICAAVGWLATLVAARQDPATILQQT